MTTPNESKTPRTDDAEKLLQDSPSIPEDEIVLSSFARQLELELTTLQNDVRRLESALQSVRKDFFQIRSNPAWQDPEVGYMSGHISAAAIQLIDEILTNNPSLKPRTENE